VRVDDIAQLLVALVALGARDRDREPHVAEAGPHGLVDPEQAARIQIGFGVDADVVDLDAEPLRVEAVDDDLAEMSAPSAYSTGLAATSSPARAPGSSTRNVCLPARMLEATEPSPSPLTR